MMLDDVQFYILAGFYSEVLSVADRGVVKSLSTNVDLFLSPLNSFSVFFVCVCAYTHAYLYLYLYVFRIVISCC